MSSGDLTFDLTKKNDQSLSVITFDALSIDAYRVSLRGPGDELVREGAWKRPPQHDTENTGHQHGAG